MVTTDIMFQRGVRSITFGVDKGLKKLETPDNERQTRKTN